MTKIRMFIVFGIIFLTAGLLIVQVIILIVEKQNGRLIWGKVVLLVLAIPLLWVKSFPLISGWMFAP